MPTSACEPAVSAVYLVRHGQSEWNTLRLTQGQTAHPRLTELGRRQAARAATAILSDLGEGAEPVAIVTSDLTRAVETAAIIADRLGARVVAPVLHDPRLREQGLGELEGQSYEATLAVTDALDSSDVDLPMGGGESIRQLHDRMASVLHDFEGKGSVVAVSHGDAIRSGLGWAVGHLPGQAPWVEVPNGAVAVIEAAGGVRWLSVPSSAPTGTRRDERRERPRRSR